MRKIFLYFSIVALLFLCTYLMFIKDTDQNNMITLPIKVMEDSCSNPKVLILSSRNVTFKNGTMPRLWLDSLYSFFTLFNYFRNENYLTIIDVKSGKIISEIPRVNLQPHSLFLSKDGKWLFYRNFNDIPFLQSSISNNKKRITGAPPFLMDWSFNGEQIVFLTFPTINEPSHVYVGDIGQCLNESSENCEINNDLLISNSSDLDYVRIIDNQKILVKPYHKTAELINFTNDSKTGLNNLICPSLDYSPITRRYVSACGKKVELLASDFEIYKTFQVNKEIDNPSWSPDGKQIAFVTSDDLDLQKISCGWGENKLQFRPSRLYIIDDLEKGTIHSLTQRIDEEIYWYSWINTLSCVE